MVALGNRVCEGQIIAKYNFNFLGGGLTVMYIYSMVEYVYGIGC
jgi:hypothetical protein